MWGKPSNTVAKIASQSFVYMPELAFSQAALSYRSPLCLTFPGLNVPLPSSFQPASPSLASVLASFPSPSDLLAGSGAIFQSGRSSLGLETAVSCRSPHSTSPVLVSFSSRSDHATLSSESTVSRLQTPKSTPSLPGHISPYRALDADAEKSDKPTSEIKTRSKVDASLCDKTMTTPRVRDRIKVEVGDDVRIINTEFLKPSLQALAGELGTVLELPRHPTTWYSVQVKRNKSKVRLRRTSFECLADRSRATVKRCLDVDESLASKRQRTGTVANALNPSDDAFVPIADLVPFSLSCNHSARGQVPL